MDTECVDDWKQGKGNKRTNFSYKLRIDIDLIIVSGHLKAVKLSQSMYYMYFIYVNFIILNENQMQHCTICWR